MRTSSFLLLLALLFSTAAAPDASASTSIYLPSAKLAVTCTSSAVRVTGGGFTSFGALHVVMTTVGGTYSAWFTADPVGGLIASMSHVWSGSVSVYDASRGTWVGPQSFFCLA